jgi:hypothetical protein
VCVCVCAYVCACACVYMLCVYMHCECAYVCVLRTTSLLGALTSSKSKGRLSHLPFTVIKFPVNTCLGSSVISCVCGKGGEGGGGGGGGPVTAIEVPVVTSLGSSVSSFPHIRQLTNERVTSLPMPAHVSFVLPWWNGTP